MKKKVFFLTTFLVIMFTIALETVKNCFIMPPFQSVIPTEVEFAEITGRTKNWWWDNCSRSRV